MDNKHAFEREQVLWWAKTHNLVNRQIVVVGAGQSGMAAVRLGRRYQGNVRLVERDPDRLTQEQSLTLKALGVNVQSGRHSPEQFAGADLVVLSPGVPKDSLAWALPDHVPVVSELEMASWFVSQPVIAITGTNGKTTTTSLINHLLTSCGYETFMGGNIGTPLSEYVLSEKSADFLVLEVSSFQLQHTCTFRPHIALFLNFSPNHLDHHRDMQEYLEAKLKIFDNQGHEDWLIIPEQLSLRLEQITIYAHKHIVDRVRSFDCPALLGPHNQLNIEAALAACRILGLDDEATLPKLKSYEAYPHRLQVVRQINGLCFVDDSKSTTFEALKAALESFEQPVCLLAGGRYKGGNPKELANLIQKRVRIIGLFGESRDLFSQAWQNLAPLFWKPTLEEATQCIYSQAQSGDIILLSPATSSFDLFQNYKERGLAFQKVVQAL
jgi:UDP-N-acetylmuramoylalanine--D-glutamate ligase